MSKFNIIAVILSGGKSSRMGKDKGLMEKDGISWVETLQQKLAGFSLPVYVSVNSGQQARYASALPKAQFIQDDPSLAHINGPLRGILSASRAHPQHHILFLPCDMPLLDQEVFDLWLDTFYQYDPPYVTVISKTPEQLQPLCGIYSQDDLQKLEALYQQGKLLDQSMHGIVESLLHAYILEIPEDLMEQFKNFNTPYDIA